MATRGERGQSIVELAFIAPILILLILGIAELGSGLNSYLTVINASRDGARLGAASADDASIRSLVEKETAKLTNPLPSSCSPGSAGICITHDGTGSTSSVKVNVCYDHPLLLGGIRGVLSGTLRMCTETTMRTPQAS